MKASVVLAASVLAGWTVRAAQPVERRMVMIDFTKAENAKDARLNAWGGEKKGRAWFDAADGGLRLVYTNSNATFSSPVIERAFSRLLAGGTKAEVPAKYSFKYRVRALDGGSQVHFNTAETYVANIGFVRDGAVHEVSLRPGGWNRNGTPFDPAALVSLYLALSGTGDLTLYELGAIYRDYPGKRPDATPMDVDAVALFPEPKVFTLDGGGPIPLSAFAAPQAFGDGTAYAADWFAKEMRTFYGDCFNPSGAKISFRIGNDDRIRHDGFGIRVREDGITVVGNEPMGVMNGVRALASLVKQFSGDVGPARIRPLTVLDWPRLKYRMLHQMMSCYGHENRYEPDDYADRLERFAVDARMNCFSFELAEYYRYESAPGTGVPPQSWTKADFTRVVDRLNAAGAKAVPFVQSPGHQALGLFANKTVRLDLREDGHRDVMCTRHPDTYPFLFGVFDEVAGVCGHNPAYKADVFYAGVDEVRWKNVPEEKRCAHCRGIPRNRLLADHIEKVDAWMRAHGYQMLMASDMFVDNHNGMNAFRCSETRQRIPKTVAFAHWASMDFEVMDDWAKEGYDNWKLLTGFQDDPVGEGCVRGYGLAIYNYNWWLSRTRAMDQGSYGLMAMRLAAANAWGEGPHVAGECRANVSRWGNFLMRNWSRKPIPHGTDRFRPVDLSAAVNVPLGGGLDWSARDVAHVPTAVAKDAEGRWAGLAAGAPVEAKVGAKAASLVFLHTAHLPKERVREFYGRAHFRDWTDGAPVATWGVRYDDGTAASVEIRYGSNVGEWNRGRGGILNDVFERFVADARFSWTAENGDTAYQYEWPNPCPEKTIESVKLLKTDDCLDYTLIALTRREAKE